MTPAERIAKAKPVVQAAGIEHWVKAAKCVKSAVQYPYLTAEDIKPRKQHVNISNTQIIPIKSLQGQIEAGQFWAETIEKIYVSTHRVDPSWISYYDSVTIPVNADIDTTSLGWATLAVRGKLLSWLHQQIGLFIKEVPLDPIVAQQLGEYDAKKRQQHTVAGASRHYLTPAVFELLPPPLTSGILTSAAAEEVVTEDKYQDDSAFVAALAVQLKEIEADIKALFEKQRKKIKRLIKWAYKQLQQLTTDIRHFIRTIIRTIRITPVDGKESDSAFSFTKRVTENVFPNTLINLSWLLNKNSFNWWNTPLLN